MIIGLVVGLHLNARACRSSRHIYAEYYVDTYLDGHLLWPTIILVREKRFSLAPSPIVRAYLASRGRLAPATMALITLEEVASAKPNPPVFNVPATVITPCDPWPRPYYLEDGLRKVHPYHFTYNTFCKERWRDRELIDIFATEFRDRPQTYYVSNHLQLKFRLCRLRRASKTP